LPQRGNCSYIELTYSVSILTDEGDVRIKFTSCISWGYGRADELSMPIKGPGSYHMAILEPCSGENVGSSLNRVAN
jgi:hypothetical protein